MWMLAMFDLPVVTPQDRRRYTRFRKSLLAVGFMKMQYSVYARYCENRESVRTILRNVKKAVPPQGQVRVISITDKQFSDMKIYDNAEPKKPEQQPEQMLLL